MVYSRTRSQNDSSKTEKKRKISNNTRLSSFIYFVLGKSPNFLLLFRAGARTKKSS